jgi:putative copper export protein
MLSNLSLVAHWLELLGLAYFIGAIFCRFFIVPNHALKLDPNLFARIWKICTFALLVMLFGHLGSFCCLVSDIDAGIDIDIIVLETHFGIVCVTRLTAIICLLLLWVIGRKHRGSNIFLGVCLGVALMISYTESVIGHPSGWGNFALPVWVNWMHVLSACVWGGGLFVLSTAILPYIQRVGQFNEQLFISIAFAFSRVALMAVIVIGATATYSSFTYIGSFEKILSTPYGWTALFKTMLFVILLGIGAYNKFYLLPLVDHSSEQRDSKAICQSLKCVVNAECILIIIVFLASALLHQQMPSSHYQQIHAEGFAKPKSKLLL